MPAVKRSITHKKQQTKTTVPPVGVRRLRLPAPRMFRLKRIQRPTRLPSVWRLSKRTVMTVWRHKWVFLGIALIYIVLNIVFVTGLGGGTDIASLEQQVGTTAAGGTGQLATSFGIFGSLLTTGTGTSSASGGAYQLVITLIISLAAIWVLRQSAAGERVRLKEAFYRGMYPLIPFMLVLVVILIQLLPFLIGATIFGFITGAGIAVTLWERLALLLLLLVPTIFSAYMLTASLFALYIVTLPDMTPLQALRSAKKLVHYRRAVVFRKLLFLPVALIILGAIIVVPAIFAVPAIATWLFFVLAILALILAHTYVYTLYRELLA